MKTYTLEELTTLLTGMIDGSSNIPMCKVVARRKAEAVLYHGIERMIVEPSNLSSETASYVAIREAMQNGVKPKRERKPKKPMQSKAPRVVNVARLRQRMEEKKSSLQRCESYLHGESLPGSYVTGRSGQSRSYGRRLSRQLDKTIDLSKKSIHLRGEIYALEIKIAAVQQGRSHFMPDTKPQPTKRRSRTGTTL